MARREHFRELVEGSLTMEHLEERKRLGWRLAVIEWERTSEGADTDEGFIQEVPYGLRVSGDCLHLEENPDEKQVVVSIMEGIVQDRKLSEIAADLNQRGYRTRTGAEWGPIAIFNLLPRLIESGPRIFNSADWTERRRRLLRVV